MNTTGVQNYLSNVFRPIVTYDAANSNFNFTPRLEMSNVDVYSGNTVSIFRADVGDSASNVYVGKESGNTLIDLRNTSRVSAFGYGAGNGISNVFSSVYLGYRAGAGDLGVSNTIAIGSDAGGGGAGSSNIFIGAGTKSRLGSRNIFLGHGIDLSSVSNQIRIGYQTQIPIAADLSRNWVGLAGVTSPTASNVAVDVSGLTVSTGGYGSIQSNATVSSGGTVTIGSVKKGIITVYAVDRSVDLINAVHFFFAPTNSSANSLISNFVGSLAIYTSGASIILSNGDGISKTFDYSITYFPTP
jgi:hypothetical protein